MKKKYIIYGNNRVAKDFMYIFDFLKILFVTDHVEEILADSLHDQIIICDFDKNQKEKELQEKGLVYGKEYVYEEDFFPSLDSFTIPTDRKVVIWGTGNMSRLLLQYRLLWKIEAFIDTYKDKDFYEERPVFLPEEVRDWRQYYVIIAVAEDQEIRRRLFTYGLEANTDFTGYREILELPSFLLQKTIFDRSYYDLTCKTMLNHLEILSGGETRCCCTTFVSQKLDNIFEKEPIQLWHSALHRILCLSTENKTFTFCDKNMCPLFVGRKMGTCSDVWECDNKPYQMMAGSPDTLSLGYDTSCNLSCITCRKEPYFAKGKELQMVNRITDKVIKEYLPKCRFLILAGSGEVFASPAYRKIYESETCNPQYIRLLSNGTLFTPENWNRFMEGKRAKIMLTVSVDAATEETYKKIRRGDFSALKQNMEFASRLRRNGGLCYFRMNFVVQKENYKEMIPFVKWGQELGVDEVFFTKILNWGTYTQEEFTEISMMEPDGVTPKQELRDVCMHPDMQSSIVDMGTIQFAHKIDAVDIVENYYMWELEKRGGKLFDPMMS